MEEDRVPEAQKARGAMAPSESIMLPVKPFVFLEAGTSIQTRKAESATMLIKPIRARRRFLFWCGERLMGIKYDVLRKIQAMKAEVGN
jgi:hypothetical protein